LLLTNGCVSPHYRQQQIAGVPAPTIHNSADVEQHLSRKKDRTVTILAKVTGLVTTPFKALGLFGWTDYHVSAIASGSVVAAAISTDRFFTVDLHLTRLQIGNERVALRGDEFLRAEIFLGWIRLASADHRILGENVTVSGELVWDGDGHLEIHPRNRADLTRKKPKYAKSELRETRGQPAR
jgi:hypothetical protein